MEEVMPKMARWGDSDADNSEGDELDPAKGVRRRCKKNILPFYPAYVRGKKRLCP